MERAADALEFERAAAVRDRIRGLTFVQGNDVINPAGLSDADVIAAWQQAGQTCIQVFFIRGGRNNGNRAFHPAHPAAEETAEVLSAFIAAVLRRQAAAAAAAGQHRTTGARPDRRGFVAEGDPQGRDQPAAARRKACRGAARGINAREALERKLAESAGQTKLLEGVEQLFKLPKTPCRIEVYDNSHIMGTNPYGVMIVSGPEGFLKSAYRKFAIRGPITPGDDFAMMREMLQRRFTRAQKEQADGAPASEWPDVVLIDGGAGQLTAARDVLADLGVQDVKVVAIAKGPDRDAGREWFHSDGTEAFQLPPRDPVLYFLQRLRDEAHRFAITTHRSGRSKAIHQSELDEIPGIGAARKRALLNHFGSARGVKMAGLNDLEAAPGIKRETARRVYAHFHPGVRMEDAS